MAKQLDGSTLKGKAKAYFEQLVELREELLDELKVHSEGSLSMEREAGGDVADIGSDNFMRDLGLGLMTEEGKRLQLVQDAIERLHEGDYGNCLDCGKDIGTGRLEAIPYAKLCVGCKAHREDLEAKGMLDVLEASDELTE